MCAAIASLLAIALAACDPPPPELRTSELCESFCECQAPQEPAHDQCVSGCTAEIGPLAIPDACLACLDEPLCTLRERCVGQCLPAQGGTP